jgi:hypothetical protein
MRLARGGVAALAAFITIALRVCSSSIPRQESVTFRGPATVEADGIANIYVTYNVPIDGELSIHYGNCSTSLSYPKDQHHHRIGETAIGSHPSAKRHAQWMHSRPGIFVWLVPEDALDAGCLYAYSGRDLIGTSEPIKVTKRKVRRSATFAETADAEGPWFDGVQYLKEKGPESVFVAEAKSKTIGIVGGGMSGLMSSVGSTRAHIFLP